MLFRSIRKFIKILTISVLLIFAAHDVYAEKIPDLEAEAYIVIDASSGRIIGEKNANKKLPMASTTKIMTSILSIDKIENLNTCIEIPEYCTNIEGSSLYLKPKQRVSIIDLLYGTMLRSGNDAALAVANYTGKNNIDDFVLMMNDKARELGAYSTNFTNPNGLHDNNHYTTAFDLALISKYAMKNNVFRQIASTKNYESKSLNTVLYNKNKVVHQYEYGSGIKIGYTKTAGRCLVASAKKDETEIIVVVLNDNSWFQDSYKVFDWAFKNYKNMKIVDKGQYICHSKDNKPLFSLEEFNYLFTEDEIKNIRFVCEVTIPLAINDHNYISYGSYKIFLGDNLIFTGTLIN